MSDIEAKAQWSEGHSISTEQAWKLRALNAEAAHEADKARHATEMREQAERFSEAAEAVMSIVRKVKGYQTARTEIEAILSPHILPKPDPLERLKTWAKKHSDVTPLDGTDRNSPTFGDLRQALSEITEKDRTDG